VAVGFNAEATGDNTAAFGAASQALGDNATSIGLLAGSTSGITGVDGLTSLGAFTNFSITQGAFGTAIGAGVDNQGTAARSQGAYSIAIGGSDGQNLTSGALATGNSAVAIGVSSRATNDFSSAYGNSSIASGLASSAYGSGSQALGQSSVAIGGSAIAAGLLDTAVGAGATVQADHGSAFGAGATVVTGHTNSTAVGTGATTTRANQVMLGTSGTTYTAAGIASAASKTAQGAPTSLVTSNGSGDLAAYTFAELGLASSGDVSNLQSQINNLGRRDKELTEGIATIASLAQPILLPGQHFAMRAGWGGYDDANAVGFSAAGVVASNLLSNGRGTLTLDGGVGFGTSEGEVAGRAGASFGW
jgi:trimeric autotransporter adhesin